MTLSSFVVFEALAFRPQPRQFPSGSASKSAKLELNPFQLIIYVTDTRRHPPGLPDWDPLRSSGNEKRGFAENVLTRRGA